MTIGDIGLVFSGPSGQTREVAVAYNCSFRHLFAIIRGRHNRRIVFSYKNMILKNDDEPQKFNMQHGDIIEILYDSE